MRRNGESYRQEKAPKIHAMKNYRRVPTKSLLRRLRIAKYEVPTPFVDDRPVPRELRILLQQHVGKPSVPIVKVGAHVQAKELLAQAQDNSLGARIHSPLAGKVTEITSQHIRLSVVAAAESGGKSV